LGGMAPVGNSITSGTASTSGCFHFGCILRSGYRYSQSGHQIRGDLKQLLSFCRRSCDH
jgi:hypothetical protein